MRSRRNTPTYVGKTDIYRSDDWYEEKHPHVRGENCRSSCFCESGKETPPRTWGKRLSRLDNQVCGGNTPTYVGKTEEKSLGFGAIEKHPHVRGENRAYIPHSQPSEETPPRTWGKLDRAGQYSSVTGNTPTYVGKTGTMPTISRLL